MSLKDWFARRTRLQMALERGMQPGGDLGDELRKVSDYKITSAADAHAICNALERLASDNSQLGGKGALRELVALFQNVDDAECPAFEVLAIQGVPHLVRMVDRTLAAPTVDGDSAHDLLYALKILALYATEDGTDAVLRAARKPVRADSYMWHVILDAYTEGHSEQSRLFEALKDALPPDFIGVSLLDCANAAHINGSASQHPFDSADGMTKIEQWLTDPDEDNFSYAISATVALPFLHQPQRDSALALALDHPSPEVQLEAAWAAVKLSRPAGVQWLVRYCRDPNYSVRAQQYLSELELADAIPADCQQPDFEAMAQFCEWLAHPNELGRPPDEVRIIDTRELAWPPELERKQFWLIEYRVRDQTGLEDDDVEVGMVGSITFCLFHYKVAMLLPEDAYAVHCYWEMEQNELIITADVPETSNEYDHMLRQWPDAKISQGRILVAVDLSRKLGYPQALVALATGKRGEQSGWLILDGPRSRWYAESEMPAGCPEKLALMVHVGRVLLAFPEVPVRDQPRGPGPTNRSAEQVVAAYERHLELARSDARQTKKLLGDSSILGSAFESYASSLATLHGHSMAVCVCSAYESLLAIAAVASPSLQPDIFDSFHPLAKNFDKYVDALIELNRQDEVPGIIELFSPHSNHNLGYGVLGGAAFRSGHDRLAESYLLQLRGSYEDWCRSEGVDELAEIWCRQGRSADAERLLIDAMTRLAKESRSVTGSDCKLFEDSFQTRRRAFLRLFAEQGEDALRTHEIPASTRGSDD